MIFELTEDLIFPHPSYAEEDGLLAVGGDLSPERLLLAYENGIFPWYSEESPILWWSPNPRMVLFPKKFKVSKSLQRVIRSGKYSIKFDNDFAGVIKNCAECKRSYGDGTWIVPEIEEAYIELHHLGYAHSIESYYEDRLVGGLYGISLGNAFFGESMFAFMPDASKAAFYHLVEFAKANDFLFIDAQQETDHLKSLGAEAISLDIFLDLLASAQNARTLKGSWGENIKNANASRE